MRDVSADTPVITGSGLVSALGFGVAASFEELLAGRCAIGPTADAEPDSGCSLAAFVAPPYLRVEPPDDLRTQVKFLNGAGELAVHAAHEAHETSGWAATTVAGEDCGLWLSQLDTWDWSCIYSRSAVMDATENLTRPLEMEALNRSSLRCTKPFFLLDSLKNNAFSFLTRWWDLRGANTGVSGYAGSSLALLDLAARTVARGDQTRALVVCTGRATSGVARNDLVQSGLSRPTADPAFRPLDRNGTGGAPGEGAAAVAIERFSTATARGAEIRGALLGYGAASGPLLRDSLPAPRPETIAGAAGRALETAGIEAGELLGIVVPANGLPETDRAMLDAMAALPATAQTPIVAWRGATGHCALASEMMELVFAMEALRGGRLPGTVGLLDPLPCAGHSLPTVATEGSGRAMLVITAGLQGEVAAVVVR